MKTTMSLKDFKVNMIVALDSKNGIGKDGTIPWTLKKDMKHFFTTTSSDDWKRNVVVMGRKTWESIPNDKKPLKNRLNVIFSKEKISDMHVLTVSSLQEFLNLFKNYTTGKIFVIGGQDIYKIFMPWCETLYVTRIQQDFECDRFFPEFKGKLEYDQEYICDDFQYIYRFEKYKLKQSKILQEYNYLEFLDNILTNGKSRQDRTGTGTLSVFAPDPLRFDISESVPLFTTKRVPWKMVIKELLWFLRGDTDATKLQKENVHIWDKNTSREFLDNRKLYYQTGILGPGYGWQWRYFGAEYNEKYADTTNIKNEILDGFDQIKYIENLLKTDPYSRRIYLNGWNAKDLDKMALVPCHISQQYYVTDINDEKYLSCHIYIRSNDAFLGNPFNVFSYAALTYIFAKRCNMKPKDITFSFGDAHIYKNHIEQVKLQLSRTPYSFPQLILSDSVATKDYSDISLDDFKIVDYKSWPLIKGDMAV